MTIEKQHHFTGVEIVCITGITEKDFKININLKDLSAYLDLALTQKYASNVTTLQTSRIQIVRQAEPSADWSLVRPSSSPLLKGIEALEQHPDLRREDPVIGLLDTIDDQARKVGIDGVLETAHDGVEERGGDEEGSRASPEGSCRDAAVPRRSPHDAAPPPRSSRSAVAGWSDQRGGTAGYDGSIFTVPLRVGPLECLTATE